MKKHKEGYQHQPVKPGEFSDWEDEQVWGVDYNAAPDKLPLVDAAVKFALALRS